MKEMIKTLTGLADIFEDRDTKYDGIKDEAVIEEFARMSSIIDF